MGHKEETRFYPLPYEQVMAHFQRALELAEYTIGVVDSQHGEFTGSPPASLGSYGLFFTARIGHIPQGTQVWIKVTQSELGSWTAAKRLNRLWVVFEQILAGKPPEVDLVARARSHRLAAYGLLTLAFLCGLVFILMLFAYATSATTREEWGAPTFFIMLPGMGILTRVGLERLEKARAMSGKSVTTGYGAAPNQSHSPSHPQHQRPSWPAPPTPPAPPGSKGAIPPPFREPAPAPAQPPSSAPSSSAPSSSAPSLSRPPISANPPFPAPPSHLTGPPPRSGTDPLPSFRNLPIPTVTIQCPECQARMVVEKLDRLQSVRCESCGAEGQIEI